MRRGYVVAAVLGAMALLASCPPSAPPVTTPIDAGPQPWRMPSRAECGGRYQELPTESAPLEDPLLVEVSGIVASPSQAGVLWMHNDSGDAPRLYAATGDGRALLRLEITGVEWQDAEDIAAAPCPDASGPCLWVADVGNNLRQREEVFIFAVPEPAVDITGGLQERSLDAADVWRFPLRYPDAPFDAEALVVLPDASALVLLEKVNGPEAVIAVLMAPFVRDGVNNLELRGAFASPGVSIDRGRMITGADLHPNGQRMLVRVYTGVFEVWLGEDGALGLAGKEAQAITLGPLSEPQGEAIAYDDSGAGLWTVSEDPNRTATQPLHHYDCL